MLNKKGFTLIELLITIAIMLTILGIAIVSFVNLSNRKKQESYELVKDQIEEAAKQYFEINGYLFEGLPAGSKGEISLGKLVGEDYLSKVTDPRTGKPFSNCTIVTVTKNGNSYDLSLDESTIDSERTTCDSDNSIVITEPGGPDIEAIVKGNKQNGWYNKKDVTVEVTAKKNGNSDISSIRNCTAMGTSACNVFNNSIDNSLISKVGDNYKYNDKTTYSLDTTEKISCYEAENLVGKKAKVCVSAKVDTTPPSLFTKTNNSNWASVSSVGYSSEIADETSKLASVVQYWNKTGLNENDANNKYKWNGSGYPSGGSQDEGKKGIDVVGKTNYTASDNFYAEGVRKIKYKACDQAGNCAYSNEAVARIDRTAPTCNIAISGQKGNYDKTKKIQWYIPNNYVTLTLNRSNDSLSGVDSYGLATNKDNYNGKTSANQGETAKAVWYGSIKDKAGNKSSCSSTFAVETSVSFAFNPTESNKAKAVSESAKGGLVFGRNKDTSLENTCGYGTCSNIRCTTNGTTKCDKNYFAKACMNVGAHLSYFNITAISAGGSKTVSVATTPGTTSNGVSVKKLSEQKNCPFDTPNNYDAYSCQRPGTNKLNVTVYEYSYTSPAGRKASNLVTLYTQYMADCGY